MTRMMQRMYHAAVLCPGFGLGGPCRRWGGGWMTSCYCPSPANLTKNEPRQAKKWLSVLPTNRENHQNVTVGKNLLERSRENIHFRAPFQVNSLPVEKKKEAFLFLSNTSSVFPLSSLWWFRGAARDRNGAFWRIWRWAWRHSISLCAQPYLTKKTRSFIVAVFLIVAMTRAASIAMGRRIQAVRLWFWQAATIFWQAA